MDIPLTEACRLSSGRKIIGQDPQAQAFIKRLNCVDILLCGIEGRFKNLEYQVNLFCPASSSSSQSSSSSSSICCPLRQSADIVEFLYQIDVNDLDDDAYTALGLLEDEVCATNNKLIEFENNINCDGISSSSSFYSSSSSSSSTTQSSSSSEFPPSSSSSSMPSSSAPSSSSSLSSSSSSSSSSGLPPVSSSSSATPSSSSVV